MRACRASVPACTCACLLVPARLCLSGGACAGVNMGVGMCVLGVGM